MYCDLDMEKPPLFDTGEFSLRFFANQNEIAVQVRSFRYSKPTTGPQTDDIANEQARQRRIKLQEFEERKKNILKTLEENQITNFQTPESKIKQDYAR